MTAQLRMYLIAKPCKDYDDYDGSYYVRRNGVEYEFSCFEPNAEDDYTLIKQYTFDIPLVNRDDTIEAAVEGIQMRIKEEQARYLSNVTALKAKLSELTALPAPE